MLAFGSLAFLNPWVLAALAALPVLWWLLRAIPPSPRMQVFAGVRLLLGLEDEERQTQKTPWWLLLLRCLAVAAVLLGFAQPVLNLTERIAGGSGPLLVLMDQGWASAPDWRERVQATRTVLDEADRAGRDVVLWRASEGEVPPLTSASAAAEILSSASPRPWEPDHAAVLSAVQAGTVTVSETIWLHDGLSRDATADLAQALAALGPMRILGPRQVAKALTPPRLEEGALTADVLRSGTGADVAQVVALAEADDGGERRIAVATAAFAGDETRATITFDLPSELQSTVTRIVLADGPSAGGAAFADGAIRRIRAGLIAADNEGAITTLTSAKHYLRKAIVPWADLVQGDLASILASEPAALILVDMGDMADADRTLLTEWVDAGGLMIRFAGPRLAASIGEQGFGSFATGDADPLLPVKLRRGGRVLGGALAWSSPRTLGAFPENSPFRGLIAPDEVDVRTQVLAEPSPDLAGKVWATLDDGTPLVTAKRLGAGHVVLFHVSSDAEWSSLPLSGLFVEMLGRLVTLAPGRSNGVPDAEAMAGTQWRADVLMGIDGQPQGVSDMAGSVPGERLASGPAGHDLPPGVYHRADGTRQNAADAEAIVVNLTTTETALAPFASAPAGAVLETLGGEAPVRYGPWLIALAVLLAMVDIVATLVVSGRLGSGTRTVGAVAIALIALGLPGDPQADEVTPEALPATAETTLGYVLTGNPRIDRISGRAMTGLGNALARRTAIEPGPPLGVKPGTDELSFYPVLYWPLIAEALPDSDALDALSRYIAGGGLLIVDTQNGASGFGGASAVQMRQIARALNLPPLAPVDADHVLTRTFYLLSDFPGRWRGGRVWAEAPPPLEQQGDMTANIPQFGRIDDNVSPVVVGSSDWASAWAVDENGFPMFPIGRPGDRQREMAIRFGVNVVMYALTGNYKSDQVHAPAVLQRLGQ